MPDPDRRPHAALDARLDRRRLLLRDRRGRRAARLRGRRVQRHVRRRCSSSTSWAALIVVSWRSGWRRRWPVGMVLFAALPLAAFSSSSGVAGRDRSCSRSPCTAARRWRWRSAALSLAGRADLLGQIHPEDEAPLVGERRRSPLLATGGRRRVGHVRARPAPARAVAARPRRARRGRAAAAGRAGAPAGARADRARDARRARAPDLAAEPARRRARVPARRAAGGGRARGRHHPQRAPTRRSRTCAR